MAQSAKVSETASKILALRKLTTDTGFRTTRSQVAILHTLNPDELAAVAELLAKHSEDARG